MRLLYTKRGRRAWGTGLGSRAGRDRHPCERTCHSRGGGAEQAGVRRKRLRWGRLGCRVWECGAATCLLILLCVPLPAPHVLPGPLPAAAGGPPADVGWGVRTVVVSLPGGAGLGGALEPRGTASAVSWPPHPSPALPGPGTALHLCRVTICQSVGLVASTASDRHQGQCPCS